MSQPGRSGAAAPPPRASNTDVFRSACYQLPIARAARWRVAHSVSRLPPADARGRPGGLNVAHTLNPECADVGDGSSFAGSWCPPPVNRAGGGDSRVAGCRGNNRVRHADLTTRPLRASAKAVLCVKRWDGGGYSAQSFRHHIRSRIRPSDELHHALVLIRTRPRLIRSVAGFPVSRSVFPTYRLRLYHSQQLMVVERIELFDNS